MQRALAQHSRNWMVYQESKSPARANLSGAAVPAGKPSPAICKWPLSRSGRPALGPDAEAEGKTLSDWHLEVHPRLCLPAVPDDLFSCLSATFHNDHGVSSGV